MWHGHDWRQRVFEDHQADFRDRQAAFHARKDRIEGRTARAPRVRIAPLLIGAMLIALVSPWSLDRLVGHSCDACIAASKADLSTLSGALQNFRLDIGRYPTEGEGLEALMHAPPAIKRAWKGPYLSKSIRQDEWGSDYVYQCPGRSGPDSFVLESCGPDGKRGCDEKTTSIFETSP